MVKMSKQVKKQAEKYFWENIAKNNKDYNGLKRYLKSIEDYDGLAIYLKERINEECKNE